MKLSYKAWKELYYAVRDEGIERGWLLTRTIQPSAERQKEPSLMQKAMAKKHDPEENTRRRMMGHE